MANGCINKELICAPVNEAAVAAEVNTKANIATFCPDGSLLASNASLPSGVFAPDAPKAINVINPINNHDGGLLIKLVNNRAVLDKMFIVIKIDIASFALIELIKCLQSCMPKINPVNIIACATPNSISVN